MSDIIYVSDSVGSQETENIMALKKKEAHKCQGDLNQELDKQKLASPSRFGHMRKNLKVHVPMRQFLSWRRHSVFLTTLSINSGIIWSQLQMLDNSKHVSNQQQFKVSSQAETADLQGRNSLTHSRHPLSMATTTPTCPGRMILMPSKTTSQSCKAVLLS